MEIITVLKAQPQKVTTAFVLLWIANICSWISFTTTSWGMGSSQWSEEQYHYGLWRRCKLIETGCEDLDGYANVWYGSVQAFAIFGHMGINLACLLIVLYVFSIRFKSADVGKLTGIICLTTAFSWVLAVIIFGVMFAEEDEDLLSESLDRTLGFSFRLAVSALVLEGVAGALMISEIKKSAATTTTTTSAGTTTTAATFASTTTTAVITVSGAKEDSTGPDETK